MRVSLRECPAVWALLTLMLGGCGQAENTPGSPTGTLCFDYFQRCVYPLALDAQLAVDTNNDGVFESVKRCSDSGCHESGGNSGGGLRLTTGAAQVALTPVDTARQSPMYVNFLSAKGRTDLVNARASTLLKKPLFEVNHGGGKVFVNDQDSAAQHISFWITNRVPAGGDEFSAQCTALFAAGNTCQPF
jgi:hypothetical protein